MKTSELVEFINKELGIKIDFRCDKYLKNNYNLYPIMEYERAKKIIISILNVLGLSAKNINIELDKLRTNTLKALLECYILEYNIKG